MDKHARKSVQIHVFIILLSQILGLAFGIESRKGFFTNLDVDDVKEDSIKSVLLRTLSVPSELSCSQKCFANDQCAYKLFYLASNKCELYKSLSLASVKREAIASKKIVAKSTCDAKPCGDKCKCKALFGTDEYACDCHLDGLNDTSPDYIHRGCSAALTANGNAKKTYLIQPTLKRGPVLVTCERGADNKSYAVFHHESEKEVTVKMRRDPCGANVYKFTYATPLETINFVINNSHHCQQKTSATCKNVWFSHYDCTWLLGRNNGEVKFWGGGPQNGAGCACGITGTCSDPKKKCNCDHEDGKWHTDEGYVTLKSVLPLSGIAVGDVDLADEIVKFTIGPLRCFI